MFQVHLWMGIALCLYMLVIGVTGAILVLEEEIGSVFYKRLVDAPEGTSSTIVSPAEILRSVQSAYPGRNVSTLYVPKHSGKNYLAFVSGKDSFSRVYVSPTSGRVVGAVTPSQSWLSIVAGLHFRLLSGSTGFMLNGIGGASLIVLCASGAVIWWQGIRHWTRGMKVGLHNSWRRINFDLHSAIGSWCLLVLSMWAITAVYFVWPKPFEKTVNFFSSTESLQAPKFTVPARSKGTWPSLDAILVKAQMLEPKGNFSGVFFPGDDKGALTVLMSRGEVLNFDKMDYLYFDPSTGRLLATWHRGQVATWGATVIFWLAPLHFGINFGLAIKLLWAFLGCALPALSITGVLMYWNRSLSKKWKRLKELGNRNQGKMAVVSGLLNDESQTAKRTLSGSER